MSWRRCLRQRHPNSYGVTSMVLSSTTPWRLIESITTLRKGQGNPILVSMICNPRRGLQSIGFSKSWTRGWGSLVPSAMRWLIIFLPRLLFFIKSPILTSFYLYKAQSHGTAAYGNVMLLATPWHHNILRTKWRCKNVVSPRKVRQHFPSRANFGYRYVSS